jgi:hypothetical protein
MKTLIALPERSAQRLTLQTMALAAHTTAMRCLDWDRDRFDIEFATHPMPNFGICT